MSENDLCNSLDTANGADVSRVEAAKKSRKKLLFALAAAACILIAAAFALNSLIKSRPRGIGKENLAMLYKSAEVFPSERSHLGERLSDIVESYEKSGREYAVVEGEVISARCFAHWENDSQDDNYRWGIFGGVVHEIRITQTNDAYNTLGLKPGSTIHIFNQDLYLYPIDRFAFLSKKTGRSIKTEDDLRTVESGFIEILPEDLESFDFRVAFAVEYAVPHLIGERYCFLVKKYDVSHYSDESVPGNFRELYVAWPSMPTEGSLASLRDEYGLRFDRDVTNVAVDIYRVIYPEY